MLRLKTSSFDGVREIGLSGSLDADTADDLLAVAVDTSLQEGCRQLMINLQAISRIDVAGLGALLRAISLARRSGTAVRIVGLGINIDLLIAVRILILDEAGESGKAMLETAQSRRPAEGRPASGRVSRAA